MQASMRNGVLLLGCLASMLMGCSRGPARDSHPWVATWATAPQAAMPGQLQTFRDQQLRLVVRTSIGGSQVRIRLSNTYGTEPLRIGAARIGLARISARNEIKAVNPDSARELRVAGQSSFTIAPGATVATDAVVLDVPPLTELAVTLYLPDTVQATTSHFLALQTSEVSLPGLPPGERFVRGSLISTWPFLTGVDVITRPGAEAMVVFGDSTVDGDGSTAGKNRRWPDYLSQRLNAAGAPGMGVVNLGIIGNRLLRDSPGAESDFGDALGEAGLERFRRDVLEQPGVSCVVVRIGINDIGFPGAFTPGEDPLEAADLIAGFRRLAALAQDRQVSVVAATLTPFGGSNATPGYYTEEKERVRRQVNDWIRTAPEFDGVVDLDAALRDPADPGRLLVEFDSGDHLHPNDAGTERATQVFPSSACARRAG